MEFRIGVLVVIVGIIVSITIGLYFFDQSKTVPIYALSGELLQIGPVSYIIEYDGLHKGNDITSPENIYYQIKILAKNTGSESTRISNSQFFITGPGLTKMQPVYSNFSSLDLSGVELDPGQEVVRTTQFDIQYKPSEKYIIQIIPTKEQSSTHVGLVCMSNCR
ncbi:MAG: hypothetical protein K8823_1637 [Cenarchaeum symbiont of Oopsacas minuta]|nr:hypothetical protein [Cenarchaeum symbiont of Oopsacas minuta]